MPIGVFVHLYYGELADEVASYVSKIPYSTDIYVSTNTEQKKKRIIQAFECSCPNSKLVVQIYPNRGWDIGPFLLGFGNEVVHYDIALKLHGKRSTHRGATWGDEWRRYLLNELVGDGSRAEAAVQKFTKIPALGMLVATHWWQIAHWISVGKNAPLTIDIAQKLGLKIRSDDHVEFPAGSMFWFRGRSLEPLLRLGLTWDDFEPTTDAYRDQTLAHAIERCFLLSVLAANRKWGVLSPRNPSWYDDPSIARGLVADSGLFDWDFYRHTYSDVAVAGIDPLDHYLSFGFLEGRDPSSTFNTRCYQRAYPQEVHDLNPLLHYLFRGRQLGYRTNYALGPLFEKERYAEQGAELTAFVDTANDCF
jgi:hypothetical protein